MLARPKLRPEKRERYARELEGPGVPEPLAYLYAWFGELWAMREVQPSHRRMPDGQVSVVPSARPFTPQMIEAWSRLFDRDPTPMEAHALVRLSYTAIHPPARDGGPRESGGSNA